MFREKLSAKINESDISSIKADIQRVAQTFGSRAGLWDKTLWYEMTFIPPLGKRRENLPALEHGCIHTNMKTNETVAFHIEPTTGKYYHYLSKMMGLTWQALDYLSVGSNIHIRGRMYMKASYNAEHSVDSQRKFWHFNQTDLGFDGLLYILLLMNEIVIVIINAADVAIVAMIVVRPIIASTKNGSVYSSDSTAVSTKQTSVSQNAREKDEEKTSTLSKMLLYTDLTSVSYRKPLLSTLLVVDAVLALEVDDRQEKLAALITEFTYITSFEIMLSTLLGIYLTFNDIMNVAILKSGLVDKQWSFTPTTPAMYSFYASYLRYSWGDRSHDREALTYIYNPLGKIISYGVLFSALVMVARLLANVAWRYHKGTLGGEVETFWRSYQRNSAEVFMDNPMRANALIRSQRVMSYRLGKAVFIRPFVYLEQNYYITRGKFRGRPEIPFLAIEDANAGAEVDANSYMITRVFRDENSHKLQKKMRGNEVQIPLC